MDLPAPNRDPDPAPDRDPNRDPNRGPDGGPPGYRLSDDPAQVDRAAVHRFLCDDSYWARGRSRSVMDRAIDNSLVIGAYTSSGAQAGFARVVTDSATHAWLCDVFVLPGHRGRGLARWMVRAAIDHPSVAGVRRILLTTLDAHGVYTALGFTPLTEPENWMQRPGTT